MVEEMQVENIEVTTKDQGKKVPFFSFTGRIGREDYSKKIFIFLGIIIIFSMFFGATFLNSSRHNGESLIVIAMLLVFTFAVSYLGLSARRLHDMGKSGIWSIFPIIYLLAMFFLMSKFFSTLTIEKVDFLRIAFLSKIINLPLVLFSLYLFFWPGQRVENLHGVPPREIVHSGRSYFEQIKQEFFSFQSRLSQKWFIGIFIATWLIQEYFEELMMISNVLIDTAQLAKTFNYFLGLGGMTISMIGILSLLFCFTSLALRRIQDIGWNRYLVVIPVGLKFFSTFYPLYSPEFFGRIRMIFFSKVPMSLLLSWDTYMYLGGLLTLVALALIPGQEGVNQYGINPVEAGLLPGEDGSAIELESEV